ncbi:phage integrase [Hyphomonas adhaerens MHS-3]|uniref:Phage integrase n=1 Tax=Hyphomonas adhaerens MHS-3 TaxID=1280949 RepID=A0A069E4V0_9PROT|nr:site-specific integrase [Hyphomonas adhaerens]KCZ85082.1 phage integrase [Hyphomonas adhaerens MHS-3]
MAGYIMAVTLNRLSAKQVKDAKGKALINDGGGLHLQVTEKGSKSWLFIYRWQGKRPEIGLGSYPTVSLAEARRRAEEARFMLASRPPQNPRDVLAARSKQADIPTFGTFAEEWLDANLDDFRNEKHRYQWRQSLSAYAKPLWELQVNAVETAHVLQALKPIWNEKRETARRVRGRMEKVLDAAKAKGLRDGENPARWRGHLKALLPDQKKQVEHLAAMPFLKVPEFMLRLRTRDALSAKVLELLILTATRSSEGRGARWSEFDLDARLWTLPPERMKAGKEHRIPLSDPAMALIEQLLEVRCSDFVFPSFGGDKHISETAVRNLMTRMQADAFTIHGFRSSFRDWAGEKTSFHRDVAEMALAHAVGDQTERAYRRGDALDKRRDLMNAWATFCRGETEEKVVSLHG